MEVTDIGDLLNTRNIKMEHNDSVYDDTGQNVEDIIPQFVTESDLGLMPSAGEILPTPLTVFSDVVEDEDTMQSNESEGDEVIVQLMDIRTRLSKLRTTLENRLGIDLSDFTFWLQDAKMLESHKTLVEQCIRGSGVVQVNIQLRLTDRKINILDVLKPDPQQPELAIQEEYEDEDVVSLEEVSIPLEESAPLDTTVASSSDGKIEQDTSFSTVDGIKHAAVAKWRVDQTFHTHCARKNIPADPNEWSVQHVKLWIQWAVRQFNLTGIKLSNWNISGLRLCALTNHEFKMIVPNDPGDIFWTHLELLRKCKFIAVIQNEATTEEVSEHQVVSIVPTKPNVDTQPSAIKKKKPKPVAWRAGDTEGLGVGMRAAHGHNGQVQLWQFLLELLTCADYCHLIQWCGTEGEFRLLEPEKVARLWGNRKHKPLMNYEKLSRALRYYYDGDMIAKVTGGRFVYRFVCDLEQLIGYTPAELAERVRQAKEKLDCGQMLEDL